MTKSQSKKMVEALLKRHSIEKIAECFLTPYELGYVACLIDLEHKLLAKNYLIKAVENCSDDYISSCYQYLKS